MGSGTRFDVSSHRMDVDKTFPLIRTPLIRSLVPGNHDVKLLRKPRGKDVQVTHGLAEDMVRVVQRREE